MNYFLPLAFLAAGFGAGFSAGFGASFVLASGFFFIALQPLKRPHRWTQSKCETASRTPQQEFCVEEHGLTANAQF
jgi:hypothetical protein